MEKVFLESVKEFSKEKRRCATEERLRGRIVLLNKGLL